MASKRPTGAGQTVRIHLQGKKLRMTGVSPFSIIHLEWFLSNGLHPRTIAKSSKVSDFLPAGSIASCLARVFNVPVPMDGRLCAGPAGQCSDRGRDPIPRAIGNSILGGLPQVSPATPGTRSGPMTDCPAVPVSLHTSGIGSALPATPLPAPSARAPELPVARYPRFR